MSVGILELQPLIVKANQWSRRKGTLAHPEKRGYHPWGSGRRNSDHHPEAVVLPLDWACPGKITQVRRSCPVLSFGEGNRRPLSAFLRPEPQRARPIAGGLEAIIEGTTLTSRTFFPILTIPLRKLGRLSSRRKYGSQLYC